VTPAPKRINAAVNAALDRVLAIEQQGAAMRMAWVRVVLSAPVAVLSWFTLDLPGYRLTQYGGTAYLAFAVFLLVLLKRFSTLGKWAALGVAFLDVPFIGLIQYLQQPTLGEMWMGIPTNVSIMCGLVALSMLSLSSRAILSTAAAASASITVTLVRSGISWVAVSITLLMPIGIALVGVWLVGRVRYLLHESRRRDLLGKYMLGERLGAGGMAEVFLATYSPEGGFERKVAVKRILPSYADSTESVALFRREAELGAQLAHPNVVQVLDFGIHEETYFMAMEFVDGVSLGRLIGFARSSGRQLPVPAIVYVTWQLAEALDYIHQRTSPTGSLLGLVHRDLNPPNVLISRIGDVKLGDFGIARAALSEQSLTAAGIFRGKVGYSAPEQLVGEPFDGRADLFALGVTLHEMLCGRRLFTGATDIDRFKACMELEPPLPSTVRAELPAALDALTMRLLDRVQATRLPTARAVIEALGSLPAALTDLKEGRKMLAQWVVEAQGAAVEVAAVVKVEGNEARTVTQATRR
jgi:hypothetical protein